MARPLSPQTRTARRVGAALRKAGIPTGYRYNAFGYRTHAGHPITEPGVEITTKGRNNLSKQDEDLDHVQVYAIVLYGTTPDDEDTFAGRVQDVLTDAGFSVRSRRGSRVIVDVPDQEA